MNILTRLNSWFAWRDCCDSGVWLYRENSVTGRRCAVRRSRCYQPLDRNFLRPGDTVVDLDGSYTL